MRFLSVLAIGVAAILAVPAHAMDVREITWGDLEPPLEVIDNPFDDMAIEELIDLRTHLEWRSATPTEQQDPTFKRVSDDAVDRLLEAGYEIEDLLEKRQILITARTKAANTPNADVLDQNVRLAGYVLPLNFDGQKVTEFLLVPTVGACIHTPPPPANQVIHVQYSAGIQVTGLFNAVWIEGELTEHSSQQKIGFSDGIAPVSSSYQMSAAVVEDFQ